MIKVTKYAIDGTVLASTNVRTIEQARAFLDSLDDNGNPKAPVQAVTVPLGKLFDEHEAEQLAKAKEAA